MNQYLKYTWQETRGDEYDSWGASVIYMELDAEGDSLRQIEVYEAGIVLKYDMKHQIDKYGMLADKPLRAEDMEAEDFNLQKISRQEFELLWQRESYNYP